MTERSVYLDVDTSLCVHGYGILIADLLQLKESRSVKQHVDSPYSCDLMSNIMLTFMCSKVGLNCGRDSSQVRVRKRFHVGQWEPWMVANEAAKTLDAGQGPCIQPFVFFHLMQMSHHIRQMAKQSNSLSESLSQSAYQDGEWGCERQCQCQCLQVS